MPVIHLALSEARYRAASATSSGVPRRLMGCWLISASCWASGMRCLLRSVRIVSGAMQFARIPYGPTWTARSWVRIPMPPLAAAYGIGDPACDRRAAAEEIVMMLPALRSFMLGRKVLIVRNVAVRLPSRDARHSSSLVCSSGPGLVKLPPALATRISIGPSSCSIWQRMPSMSLNLVMSATRCMARPPACSISPRTAESAAPSLPWTTTLAHWRANSLAMAAPIPRELPVTKAVLSFNRSTHILLFQIGSGDTSPRSRSGIACHRHASDRDHQKSCGDALACCHAMAQSRRFGFVYDGELSEGRSARHALDARGDECAEHAHGKNLFRCSKAPWMHEVPEQAAGRDNNDGRAHLRPEELICLISTCSSQRERCACPKHTR